MLERAAAAGLLLCASFASAARYDPDADRGVLRQAASLAYSTVVDATGLPLVPEKAPAVAAGLDEGERQARLAAGAAGALADAARRRGEEMGSGVKEGALDGPIKKLGGPIAAERARWERLEAERGALRKKADGLPEEERRKIQPLLSEAGASLRSAAALLSPLEDALALMAERGGELKELRRDAQGPLVEISSAAAGTIVRAGELVPAMAEAKARLGELDREPRAEARTRAWEKLEPLRVITRLLFQDADRACNRAYDLRRLSAEFERASAAFERARGTAAAGPGAAKLLLDEGQKSLAEARRRL